MSSYFAGKFFFDLVRKGDLIEQFNSAPEAVLANYRLTDEERTAILNRDFGFFYREGVHPLLLAMSTMPLRIPPGQYRESAFSSGTSGSAGEKE